MPGYVVVDATVHDADAYKPYTVASPGAVASAGGRFIARGGETVTLEGHWHPQRVVLVTFPDLETIRRWYVSDEYQAAKALRDGAADLQMIGVEGAEDPEPGERPGYVIVDAAISDPEKYAAYREEAGPAAAKYGGRYLARGGETEVLEGTWEPGRIVVAQFRDLQTAQDWYRSPEYTHARSLRAGGADVRIVAVEGV